MQVRAITKSERSVIMFIPLVPGEYSMLWPKHQPQNVRLSLESLTTLSSTFALELGVFAEQGRCGSEARRSCNSGARCWYRARSRFEGPICHHLEACRPGRW